MEKKIAPSERKAQEIQALVQGQTRRAKWRGIIEHLSAAVHRAGVARGVGRGTSGGVGARAV